MRVCSDVAQRDCFPSLLTSTFLHHVIMHCVLSCSSSSSSIFCHANVSADTPCKFEHAKKLAKCAQLIGMQKYALARQNRTTSNAEGTDSDHCASQTRYKIQNICATLPSCVPQARFMQPGTPGWQKRQWAARYITLPGVIRPHSLFLCHGPRRSNQVVNAFQAAHAFCAVVHR